MTRRTATGVVRASAAERCLTGVLLLGVPDTITRLVAGDQPLPPSWLVRVLGGRLLAQGVLEYTRPRRSVIGAGAAVDTAHAASMIAAAALLPAYRRTALASAAEAMLLGRADRVGRAATAMTATPATTRARRTSAKASSALPPHVLREYALLADGERGVVVGPRGDIAWMCVPRWDSDAIFSALVGGHAAYTVTPDDTYVWGGYYEDASMIWRNRWTTRSGIIECRDALVYPAEPHRAILLRQIRAVDGPGVSGGDAAAAGRLRPAPAAATCTATPGSGPPAPATCTCAGPEPRRPRPGSVANSYCWR